MQKDYWKKLNPSKLILTTSIFFIILLGNNINAQFNDSKKTEKQVFDTLNTQAIFIDSIKNNTDLNSINHSSIHSDSSDIVVRSIDSIKI